MHQPVLGALFPFLAAAMLYIRHGGRASLRGLIVTPLTMVAGALWAVAPDIPRLVGAHALYMRLARDPRTDVFFWHYTIDRIEQTRLDTLGPLFTVLLVLLMTLLFAAAWRELQRAERDGFPFQETS